MLAPDNVQSVCMEHIYDRDPAVACMGKGFMYYLQQF